MVWEAAAANMAIAVAYMAICIAIVRPLVREGQFPSNRLASATAAIFFSCSIGHALHAVTWVAGMDAASGAGHAMSATTMWAAPQAIWDGLTAAVGVYYWSLRRSYRGLLHGGRLFDDLQERQRRELAETTRDSERRYRGVFDQALAGMAIMDTRGTITRVNAALCALVGRTEEELLGLRFVELIHPDDARRDEEALRRVLAGEDVGLHGDRRLRHADGRDVHAAVSASLVRDDAGRPEQFVAQLVDISALVEGQRALRVSEEQFRSVFDNALVGMVLTAPDGRMLRVNGALCEMLGYTADQLDNAGWADITHPDDVEESARMVRATLAGERSGFSLQKRYLHADGSVVTVDLATVLLRAADGRPVYFATQMTDITHRRRLEARLREQHDQYERLLEGLSELGEGVVVDDDGKLVYANDAFCRLSGYSRAELQALEKITPLVASAQAEQVEGGGEAPTGGRGTLTLRRRDQTLVPADYASIKIHLDGQVRRLSVIRDLSERLRWTQTVAEHADQLARANAELRAANELKTDLLAMLSHDIGQPLTAIRGYAQLLVQKWEHTSDDTRLMMLGHVRTSAERLGQLVAEVLTMGKTDTSALVANRSHVPLTPALEQAMASLANSIPGLTLSPSDAAALVDPGHLQQMLVNLVSNAGKYGRPPIEIQARAFGDGWVEIRVQDHGDGVPAEFVPRLFNRYARAEVTEAKGTGLGLFIVRRLADANGGSVHYDGDRSSGACFVLRLPHANRDVPAETRLPADHLTG